MRQQRIRGYRDRRDKKSERKGEKERDRERQRETGWG